MKCQFAFALSHDPKILILDEPTGNFDPEFREQFWEELMIFMEDGTRNVILATHLKYVQQIKIFLFAINLYQIFHLSQ